MAYIKVSVDDTNLYNGQIVSFVAPCDCVTPEGLKICDTAFNFVDSMGNSVIGNGGYFTAGSIVTVVLDVDNLKAYIQNAVGITSSVARRIELVTALPTVGTEGTVYFTYEG